MNIENKIMICDNCGAEISESDLLCPYCGAENEKLAQKQQEDVLEEYQQKTKDLQHMPKKVINKTSKYILIGAAALIILFLIGLLISWLISGHVAENSLDKQSEQLDKLEAYYDEGNYTEMYKYLDKIHEYGVTYEKYRRIGMLYDNMQWRIEAIEEKQEFIRDLDLEVSDVATTMGYVLEPMVEIKTWAEDGFRYGEEEAALDALEQYKTALRKYMLLTDEEINNAVAQYQQTGNCDEYAQISISRIKNEAQ